MQLKISFKKIVTAVLGIVLAAGSFSVSWAGLLRFEQPEIALIFAPWDAGAKASLAGQSMLTDSSERGLSTAWRFAVESAKRQALSAASIRTLAVVIDARGDRNHALRVMRESEKLSRRDLLAQLWLIEHFSGTDDITQVLLQYDRALTGSHESLPILFPVLIEASTDQQLATPLTRFLARSRQRAWYRTILGEIATKSPDPASAGRVVGAVLHADDPRDRELFNTLIERNISVSNFDDAFALYVKATEKTRAVSNAGLLRDGDFMDITTFPPFDWLQANDGSMIVERRRRTEGSGSALFVSGRDAGDGVVARQLVKLGSGDYQLTYAEGISPSGGLRFALSCAERGAGPSWTIVDTQRIGRSQEWNGRFTALGNCQWHWVAIRITANAAVSDQELWIGSVTMSNLTNKDNR